jgi:hypothetical protein
VVDSCEHGNEMSGSINGGEFLEYQSDYENFKSTIAGFLVKKLEKNFADIILLFHIIYVHVYLSLVKLVIVTSLPRSVVHDHHQMSTTMLTCCTAQYVTISYKN